MNVEPNQHYSGSVQLKDKTGVGAPSDTAPMLLDVKKWRQGDPSNKVAWLPGQAGNYIQIPDVNLLDTRQASFDNVAFDGTVAPEDRYETWGTGGGTAAGAFTDASPMLIDLEGWGVDRALWLPSTGGNFAQVADNPALRVTGDLDLRVKLAPKQWSLNGSTPSSVVIAKWASDSREYALASVNGFLALYWSTDGTATTQMSATSTVLLTSVLTDRQPALIRATLDVDNGSGGWTVTFYYSTDDGENWTALGSPVTGSGTTSVFVGSSPLYIGRHGVFTAGLGQSPFVALSAQIRDGIDGTIVYDEDFTADRWAGADQAAHAAVVPADRTSFTRASSAYLDGAEVPAGTPRYPYGRNLFPRVTSEHEEKWIASSGTSVTSRVTSPAPFAGTYATQGEAAGDVWYSYLATVHRPEVAAGDAYVGSVYVRTDRAYRSAVLGIYWYGADNGLISNTFSARVDLTPGEWVRVTSHPVTAPEGATQVRLFPRYQSNDAATILDVDEEWWASAGQVEEGDTATPWRPGGPSAVLIEEGTTNLLADGAFADPAWWTTKNGTEFLASGGYGGVPTCVELGTTLGTSSYCYRGGFPEATSTVTLSAYVRLDDGTEPTTGTTGTNRIGLVAGGALLGAEIQKAPVGGGWWRVWATVPSHAAGNTGVIHYSPAVRSRWSMIQYEAKPFATSWHPGGETRPHDHLILPFLPAPRTIELDVAVPVDVSDARYLFVYGGWNADNSVMAYLANDILVIRTVRNGLNPSVNYTLPTPVRDGAYHRFAIVLHTESNEVELVVDGVSLGRKTSDGASHPVPEGPQYEMLLGTPSAASGQRTPQFIADGIRLSSNVRTATELSDWTVPLTADAGTTYLNTFEGSLEGEYGAQTTINRAGDSTAEIVDRDCWAFTGAEHIVLPRRAEIDFDDLATGSIHVASSISGIRHNGSGLTIASVAEANSRQWQLYTQYQKIAFRAGGGVTSGISEHTAGRHLVEGFSEGGIVSASVDGLYEASGVNPSTSVSVDYDMLIGARRNSGNTGVNTVLAGQVEWLALFRRVLTATERATLAAWDGTVATEPVWLRPLAVFYVNANDPFVKRYYQGDLGTNEVLNLASAPYGELGWQLSRVSGDGSLTMQRDSITQPLVGSMYLRVTNSGSQIYELHSEAVGPVTPGQLYSCSIGVSTNLANASTGDFGLVWYDEAEGEIDRDTFDPPTVTGGGGGSNYAPWIRVSHEGVAPAGAAKVGMVWRGSGWGMHIFDAAVIRQGPDTGYVPSLRVREDLDVRWRGVIGDNGSYQTFISKYGPYSGTRGWLAAVSPTDNYPRIWYTTDGINTPAPQGSTPIVKSNEPTELRFVLSPSSTQIMVHQDGTSIMDMDVPSLTSIFHTSYPVNIGAFAANNYPLKGAALSAQIRDGIDGPVLLDLDIANWPDDSDTYEMPNGLVAEIVRSGDATAEIVDYNTWAMTGHERLQIEHRGQYQLQDRDFSAAVRAATRSASRPLFRKGAGSGDRQQMDTFGGRFRWFLGNDDGFNNTSAATSVTVTDGEPTMFIGSRSGREVVVRARSPESVHTLEAEGIDISNESQPIEFGHSSVGGEAYGLYSLLVMFTRSLEAEERDELAAWDGTVATEPVWLRSDAVLYLNADDPVQISAYQDGIVIDLAGSGPAARLEIDWLDEGGALINTAQGPDIGITYQEYERFDYTATAPSNAAQARMRIVLPDGYAGQQVVADAAMFEKGPAGRDYFDGSYGGGDYLWEDVAHASPTHYFDNRLVKQERLNQILEDYVPLGVTWTLEYPPHV